MNNNGTIAEIHNIKENTKAFDNPKESREHKLFRLRDELKQAVKEYAEPLGLKRVMVSGDILNDNIFFSFSDY